MSDGNGNGQICTCGLHEGVGNWSPGRRAAVYQRMSERMPDCLTSFRWEYLKTWKQYHGPVIYEMRSIGINDGQFNKASKGLPIMAPFLVGEQTVLPPPRSGGYGWQGEGL